MALLSLLAPQKGHGEPSEEGFQKGKGNILREFMHGGKPCKEAIAVRDERRAEATHVCRKRAEEKALGSRCSQKQLALALFIPGLEANKNSLFINVVLLLRGTVFYQKWKRVFPLLLIK